MSRASGELNSKVSPSHTASPRHFPKQEDVQAGGKGTKPGTALRQSRADPPHKRNEDLGFVFSRAAARAGRQQPRAN